MVRLPTVCSPIWRCRKPASRVRARIGPSTSATPNTRCSRPRLDALAPDGWGWAGNKRENKREEAMTRTAWRSAAVALAGGLSLAIAPSWAQQSPVEAVHIGDNDLGGTVTSANGPEAGVWVIAETTQ